MRVTDIARRRMRNTRLAGPSFEAPDDVVQWHGAMQAQDYGPAKWSLGQRSVGLVDADLDRALAEGSIVRTHVLRPTWHFVARDDLRWLLALTGPRVHRHNARRYRELGLDGRTLARSQKIIASSLRGGKRLTRDEVAGVLAAARIDASGQRLPYILLSCELDAVIGSGGSRGKQQTYALLDERVPPGRRFDRHEAVLELVRRYLGSHGPATVQDLRWWSSLTVADLRNALGSLGSEVVSETADGLTFWSLAGERAAPRSVRGAHLLQAYDELIVGYTESRYIGDPRGQALHAARIDRRLPSGVVILNGRLAGHWRRTVGRDVVAVEVLLYEEPTRPDERALAVATRRLSSFLHRRSTVEIRRL